MFSSWLFFSWEVEYKSWPNLKWEMMFTVEILRGTSVKCYLIGSSGHRLSTWESNRWWRLIKIYEIISHLLKGYFDYTILICKSKFIFSKEYILIFFHVVVLSWIINLNKELLKDFSKNILLTFQLSYIGRACGVTVIVVGNRFGYWSSNPERGCISYSDNILGKTTNPTILLSDMGK